MHCPRCGQRRLSDEVRYCSRCGFPLGGVAALLEAGGEVAPAGAERRGLTARQVGTRKGLAWMAGALVFALFVPAIAVFDQGLFVLMFPAAVFFVVGFIRMLYGLMLEDDTPPSKQISAAKATATLEAARAAELPPARQQPAADFAASRAATAEMAAPPSVAEGTTKILQEGAGGRPSEK